MNFNWAMERLKENKRVRRFTWPYGTIELPSGTYRFNWHLFMAEGFLGQSFWEAGIINGWGDSIGGAADDDPIRNGMVYSPTKSDCEAGDWELL